MGNLFRERSARLADIMDQELVTFVALEQEALPRGRRIRL